MNVVKKLTAITFSSMLLITSVDALCGPAPSRDQAVRMYSRLTGTLPSESIINSMTAAGSDQAAADIALNDENFLATTVKNFAAPWTNREQTVFTPLNDYIATVIGLTRDEGDFREVLYGDVIYTGAANLGISDYSNSNNNHYQAFETGGFSYQNDLIQQDQSSVTGLSSDATAGVMTTRAAAKSFFIAGTNRAMFRFTLMNHLCRDLEQVHDVTRTPDRIRQDVSRSPGGDSRVFMNNCIGCHSGMDPLAQAYAYYSYDYDVETDPEGDNGQLVYNTSGQIDPVTGSRVQEKYRINSANFPYGFITPNDAWDNYWRQGVNSHLGWDSGLAGSGNGAKSMGMELAHSDAFAQCQVTKVFEHICLRSPETDSDISAVETMTDNFKSASYNLQQPFADAAIHCMGP